MADRVRTYPQKKLKYFTHMNNLFDNNEKVVIVDADNVGSNQMQKIRIAMRGKADLLLGKNTMMKRCLQNRLNASNSDRDKLLYSKFVNDRLIAGNIGLIFTNSELSSIKDIVEQHRVQAPAKAGAVAPVDVTVPAGNTGLEPTKTSFFQALNIPTKITKGTVEILKDQQVVTATEKVGSSEAALLQMLNIKPFYYGLEIRKIYDNGSVYGAQVLGWGETDIVAKFQAGAGRVKCFARGLGIPTKATIDSVMLSGFKKIMAISLATEYEFEEFNGKDLRAAILAGPVAGSGGGGGGGGGGAAAAPAKKEEEEEDSEEEMGMGLFD